MNYVPRDGGNTFKGLLFFSGANGSMQATNYTTIADDPVTSLQARGLRTQPGALDKVYDFNPGYGGPIVKDKLWWFASARWTKAENFVTQDYPNKNFVPGVTPSNLFNNTTMTYVPDLTQPLATTLGGGGNFKEQTLRLSWQVTPRNKIGAYYNNKVRTVPERRDHDLERGAELHLLLPVLGPVAAVVLAGQQPAAPRGRRLAPPGNLGRLDLAVQPGRSAGDWRDRTTTRARRSRRLHRSSSHNYHGRVGSAYTPSHNPNTRTNFAASVRHRLPRVQGRHRLRVGGTRRLDRFGRAVQLRRRHTVPPRQGSAFRCPPPSVCARTAASIRWPAWSTAGSRRRSPPTIRASSVRRS